MTDIPRARSYQQILEEKIDQLEEKIGELETNMGHIAGTLVAIVNIAKKKNPKLVTSGELTVELDPDTFDGLDGFTGPSIDPGSEED